MVYRDILGGSTESARRALETLDSLEVRGGSELLAESLRNLFGIIECFTLESDGLIGGGAGLFPGEGTEESPVVSLVFVGATRLHPRAPSPPRAGSNL